MFAGDDDKPTIDGAQARLLIVGRVRAYCEALAGALTRHRELRVVSTFSPKLALDKLGRDVSDVVLVEVACQADAQRLTDIVRLAQGTPVVAFGVPPIEEVVIACVESGIYGLITDDSSLSDLATNVRGIALHDLSATMTVAQILLRELKAARDNGDPHKGALTRREHEILQLVAADLSNKEIAAALHLAVPTVKNHVQSILRKLGVSRRTEAAGWLRSL